MGSLPSQRAIALLLCASNLFFGSYPTPVSNRVDQEQETSDQRKAAELSDQGLKLYKQGNLLQAVEVLSEGLNSCKFHSPLYYNRGLVWSKLKKPEKAIADFKSFIDLSPGDHDGYIKLGRAYRQLKKWKESQQAFTEGLKKCSKYNSGPVASDSVAGANILERKIVNGYAYLLWNRAEMFAESEQYKNAIVDYDRYLRIRPNDKEAVHARRKVYQELNKSIK